MSDVSDDPCEMDEAALIAWRATLTADENFVLHTTPGRRFDFLFAAYLKRALTTLKMKAGERLQLLEWLNQSFSPNVLAAIQPMSEAEAAIMREARSLDRKDDPAAMASFRVLTSWKVFGHFLRLNPSYLAAIKLFERRFVPTKTEVA